MSWLDWIYIAVMLVCLVLSAFFSCSEMAYSTVNVLRLRKAARGGSKAAAQALDYAESYDNTVATILFGNDLVNVIIPSVGTLLAVETGAFYKLLSLWFGADSWIASQSETVMTGVLLVLILLFGEIIPKSIGRAYNYRLSLSLIYPIKFFKFIFRPVVWLSTKLVGQLLKPLAKRSPDPDKALNDEELQSMIDEIEEEGIIDEAQSELLYSAIEFKDTTAEEIMTPRVNIEGYSTLDDFNEWCHKPDTLRHSRVIVYRKSLDDIIGYIPTKQILKRMLDDTDIHYQQIMLPIVAVPSTMEISSILRLMKKSHHHIALVKDEYGGNAGILTLEDILEELVGELYDESEDGEVEVKPGEKRNVYYVQGSMDIHSFFEEFELDPEYIDEDYNTVSGWITDKLERFAKVGDSFIYEKLDVEVTECTDYTVTEAKITKHPRRKIKRD